MPDMQPIKPEDDFEIPVKRKTGGMTVIRKTALVGKPLVEKPAPPAARLVARSAPRTALPAQPAQKHSLPEPVPEERVMVPTKPVREAPLPPVPRRAGVSAERAGSVYDRLAAEIIRSANLSIPPTDGERLKTIVLARLKDIRDYFETADALTRSSTEGGMGLKPTEAKVVLDVLEPKVTALAAELAAVEKKRAVESRETAAASKAARVSDRSAAEVRARDLAFAAITGKKAVGAPLAAAPAAPDSAHSRAAVRDITPPPSHLVGPVEELRVFTLAEFRKLSREAHEAAFKIRDKIDRLGEQSVADRAAGITAWKESEPVRLYRDLIAAALSLKRPVRDLVAERSKAGSGLTVPEFNAIMELQSLLR